MNSPKRKFISIHYCVSWQTYRKLTGVTSHRKFLIISPQVVKLMGLCMQCSKHLIEILEVLEALEALGSKCSKHLIEVLEVLGVLGVLEALKALKALD